MKKTELKIISSIRYITKLTFECCPVYLLLIVLLIPVQILISYISIRIPGIAVELAENNAGIYDIIRKFAFVGIISVVLYGCDRIILEYLPALAAKIRNSIIYLRTKKILTTCYENLEKEDFRTLMQKALEATWNMGNGSAVDGIPKSIGKLITNIISYFVFGSMLMAVNRWIVVILTITPIIHYLLVKNVQRKEYKNRDVTAKTDRKLWYISSKCGRFEFGKDIRVFGMNEWLRSLYKSFSAERLGADKYVMRLKLAVDIADGLMILLRDGIAYIVLIRMVLNGEIALSEFAVYFTAIGSFATWIGNIIDSLVDVYEKHMYIYDLKTFINYPDYKSIGKSIAPLSGDAAAIRLEHVYYSYSGADEDTLKDISLDIKPGEKVALVGMNGAGKTTLIMLICGLYHATRGRITVNNVAVDDYKPDEYYSMFSPVFQEFHIMPVSLRDNVSCVRNSEADENRVKLALSMAELDEKVGNLEHGLDSQLNKLLCAEATELSGGEKQRLALARAVYKDAPILILDEPTAALDPLAEEHLYRKYAAMCENKTSIFISHRLASTQFCDRVILLDRGAIAEEGTHEQLMMKNGKYAEMYNVQSKYYKAETEDYDEIPE